MFSKKYRLNEWALIFQSNILWLVTEYDYPFLPIWISYFEKSFPLPFTTQQGFNKALENDTSFFCIHPMFAFLVLNIIERVGMAGPRSYY